LHAVDGHLHQVGGAVLVAQDLDLVVGVQVREHTVERVALHVDDAVAARRHARDRRTRHAREAEALDVARGVDAEELARVGCDSSPHEETVAPRVVADRPGRVGAVVRHVDRLGLTGERIDVNDPAARRVWNRGGVEVQVPGPETTGAGLGGQG
jgi:hypothetical protein